MESQNHGKSELRIPPPPGPGKRPLPVPRPSPVMSEAATSAIPVVATDTAQARTAQNLSTVELVGQITADVTRLARKEIELAKTELKANLKTQALAVSGLAIAAVAALCTINLLLVTAVLGLATVLPGWGAGLIVSGSTLATSAIIAWFSWSQRVRKPLERTQRTLKDDVQWTKERLA